MVGKIVPDHKTIRSGDTTKVILTCKNSYTEAVIDISTATTKQIKFVGNTESVTKTASFTTDGTDGKIEASLLSTDLTETGIWKVQAYVVLSGGGSYHSEIFEIKVEEAL